MLEGYVVVLEHWVSYWKKSFTDSRSTWSYLSTESPNLRSCGSNCRGICDRLIRSPINLFVKKRSRWRGRREHNTKLGKKKQYFDQHIFLQKNGLRAKKHHLELHHQKTNMTIKYSTIWRRISYWTWGFSNVMIVFREGMHCNVLHTALFFPLSTCHSLSGAIAPCFTISPSPLESCEGVAVASAGVC